MSIDYTNMMYPKQTRIPKKERKKEISKTNREKIKMLYKGKCALCGRKGNNIHHIIYKSEDRTKIDDIDNLILLCVECHNQVHSNKAYWQPRLIELRNYKNKY